MIIGTNCGCATSFRPSWWPYGNLQFSKKWLISVIFWSL